MTSNTRPRVPAVAVGTAALVVLGLAAIGTTTDQQTPPSPVPVPHFTTILPPSEGAGGGVSGGTP